MSKTIQQFGNQLIINTDGVKEIAYPTMGGLWIVGGAGVTPPAPGLFAWPFDPSIITDGYGYVPGHMDSFHHGIDFGVASGTPIPNTKDGTIDFVTADNGNGYGNYCAVDHGVLSSGSHAGKQCYSMYAHMSAPSTLAVGAAVSQGDILGPSGATGFVTGPCLHWEIHIADAGQPLVINSTDIDPQVFMAEYGPA